MPKRRWTSGAALLLLLLMMFEVALSTRHQSPSWDEGDHIYSGYMNWKEGQYALNPEHPPLVKLVATLPLLPLQLKTAPRQGRYFKDEAYFAGRELLFHNGPADGGLYSIDTLLFRVHMAALVFGLVLGFLLFVATREMFGELAALIALTLFAFDPSVLAFAPMVATDTGAACGFFAAVYTFYRFVRRGTVPRALVCGLACGLALAAKHSTVLLLPVLLLLAAAEAASIVRARQPDRAQRLRTLSLGVASIAALAFFVLWSIYGFHYAMHPSGVTMLPLSTQVAALPAHEQSFITFFARFHLLPESYLYGMVDVLSVGDNTPTFVLGKVYEHGLWFYFPLILSLKWTAATLALLVLALFALASPAIRAQARKHARELLFLALPAFIYLLVAMAGPLNIGVRHILPVFPFVFALIAAGAAALARRSRPAAALVALLLLVHAADSLRTFPDYIPYGNVFWGGSAQTHRFFSDSAADWAQQLKEVKNWTDQNHIQHCAFAYFAEPFLHPPDYGIPCTLLPTFDSKDQEDLAVPAVVHGPILVSYGDLNGFEFGTKVLNPYQSLFTREPDAQIGHGVAVFYGDVALPEAAALQFEHHAFADAARNPAAALAAARQAVALVPGGFESNRALATVLTATGDPDGARAAYTLCQQRIAEMEPSARAIWEPMIATKIAQLPQPR